MRTGSQLLAMLERCGLSAALAEQHREISDDSSGARVTRQEICRAWATKDQPQTEDAHAALVWLSSLGARNVYGVGEELDLVDQDGVVLVSGRPGAIIEQQDGELLVVSWVIGDPYDPAEPEDDLGLLAMGLAVDIGKGFRVGHVYIKGGDAVCRRSPVFPVGTHPALWDRIRQATSRPRVACPGDWCGACRQNIYCEAWLARAKTGLSVVMGTQLDITSDNAGALAEQIKMVKAATKMAEDQLKSAVRKGVRCVVDGKEYSLGHRDGVETVDKDKLRSALGEEAEKFIKRGQPFEMPGWRKAQP